MDTQENTDTPIAHGSNAPLRRFRTRGGRSAEIETLGELLFWSYANLAAASAAEKRGLTEYDTGCWMIRAKLFKGLSQGTMNLGTLFSDVREMAADRCAYCAATAPPKLHGDHMIPKHRGGPESADNLVWACRSCNSSKGARDMLEWYAVRSAFPPLALIRRYLKLAIADAHARQLMAARLADTAGVTFSVVHIPLYYPLPGAIGNGPMTCGVEGCSAFASSYCDAWVEAPLSESKRCGKGLCGTHVCRDHDDEPRAEQAGGPIGGPTRQ